MRSWFHHAALILALLAGTTLAVAQENATTDHTVGIAMPPAGATADDDPTGSLGTVGVGHGKILPLTDEQRGWIFLGVINLPDVPEAAISAPEATAALPGSVELQDLPAIVTQKIPLVGNYKFVKLEDRILLVDPANREVVAEIPRFKLVN